MTLMITVGGTPRGVMTSTEPEVIAPATVEPFIQMR